MITSINIKGLAIDKEVLTANICKDTVCGYYMYPGDIEASIKIDPQ